MLRMMTRAVALAVIVALLPAALALGDPGVVAPFQGVWIGSSVEVDGKSSEPAVTASDIGVTIRADGAGFEMTWKALRQGGAEWITARFVPAAEPGSFALAGAEPPLPDGETIRAEIVGNRLVVRRLSTDTDRSEHVTRYRRSTADNRMTFDYVHRRNGEAVHRLTGSLTRAKVVL